jgi:radical SAM protein with 4Fe4S-binding SPASM domain
LDAAGFERIVKKLPASVTTLYLWGQGEPFLAPEFLDMVRFAAGRGFRTVTSTNGHFLDNSEEIAASGLDLLIVSLDGADAETYASYRIGGDFERVVRGVRNVVEAGKRVGRGPVVRIQCVVNRRNEDSLGQFRKLAKETGVHQVDFKTLQAVSMEGGDAFLPRAPELSRYRRGENGILEPDKRKLAGGRCLRIYYSLQVDCQGNVVPCCFDKNSAYVMGNLWEDSFRDIWNGERFYTFRSTLNRRGRILPMCRDCTEGLRRVHIHA